MTFDPDAYLAKKKAAGFDPDAYLASKAEPVGKGESFLRGGAQGLSLGFADELEGLLRSIGDKTYPEARDAARAEYDAAKKANPKTYTAGQVGGAVLPFVVAPEAAAPALGLKGMVAMGAAQGLGESTKSDVLGELWDTIKGGGVGALAHGAGRVLEPGVAALSGKAAEGAASLKEGLEDTAGYAANKAVGMTKLLRKKFGPQRVEEAGKILTQGENPVVAAGLDTADMTARAQALKETSGGQIGSIMHDLDVSKIHTPDAGRMMAEVAPSVERIKGVKAAAPLANQYRKGLSDLKAFGRKPSFERLQDLKKIYGDLAFPGGKAGAEGVEGYRDIYGAIKNELERSTEEGVAKLASGIPKTRMPMETYGDRQATTEAVQSVPDIYRGAKQNYGAAKMALAGLKDKAAMEGNKFMGLTDWVAGGAGMGAALFTHDPATAVATAGIVGAKKLMEKQGPQVIATGATKLAARIQTNPAVYGKYAQTLLDAAKRGTASLASTDFVLQQRDPEYRAIKDKLDKDEGQ